MIYLTRDYLNTFAFEKLIDESINDYEPILDNIEASSIELIKTYLSGIFDIDKIFDPEAPIQNELLKTILAKLVLYGIVRRNAARKVPTDYKEEYEWAIKQLENINSGKLNPGGLPPLTDENGNTVESTTLIGNLSNSNFYI
ncbi:DUF1320 domain-containing protein [Apibacter muscae]|uniref:DUF1320 domain-containing protein n=1 Tax=Apibacter muscae TaxID=2509004 RepID=A0A563DKA9_9FLAO|nr:phage protein Gp36 family protein [Apibacter muscae]TWP30522.1 DUF1320 domain-containing protein [Apibacter muscae]TWP31243.1 DUF1320 domain-containing protein [Apibacter muscae]